MVDVRERMPRSAHSGAERLKFKNLMGIDSLKSKFLTVIGNSNELLNGISNKLAFSISSSDSDYCDDDDEIHHKFDETIDYTKIDFESRRVKARRAHEEVISGCFRYPNLLPASRSEYAINSHHSHHSHHSSPSNDSSSSSPLGSAENNDIAQSRASSTTRSNSIESRYSGGYGRPGRVIAGARRSDLDMQKDQHKAKPALDTSSGAQQIDLKPAVDKPRASFCSPEAQATDNLMILWPTKNDNISHSSTITSLNDGTDPVASPSVESSEWKHFIRSESQNSVPSWASSISLDNGSTDDDAVKEFMLKFTEGLFINASIADTDLKAKFEALAHMENGRKWFVRHVLQQKTRSKRLSKTTLYCLVQYFAIILFECGECQDYPPAAVIMNLCFTFYYEIEVPGCDPYHEYLYTLMRQQPIWQVQRFWNAAFYDSVQRERDHRTTKRPLPSMKAPNCVDSPDLKDETSASNEKAEELEISSSSSSHGNTDNGKQRGSHKNPDPDKLRDMKFQEHVVFRQIGVFTCKMHALGISQEKCMEFLKRQSANFNLPKDKVNIIKDNIHRMYHETDLWGTKAF